MSTMSASQARATLPQLLDRVAAGDEVTITRHGHPVAVLVRPDALRARRAEAAMEGAARVHDALAAGRAARLPSGARGVSAARAEELIAEVRAGRERA
jgi:prevent-host-death family protein